MKSSTIIDNREFIRKHFGRERLNITYLLVMAPSLNIPPNFLELGLTIIGGLGKTPSNRN